ncbi:hypothetical protein [Belnapia moabensis]|uniref:hypothetical protein n=1 Tax=Belnapia moabensis TaxID=365533 RepID=UPI0012EE62EF|nr:hypothetical protein [Belnapia moabensis]
MAPAREQEGQRVAHQADHARGIRAEEIRQRRERLRAEVEAAEFLAAQQEGAAGGPGGVQLRAVMGLDLGAGVGAVLPGVVAALEAPGEVGMAEPAAQPRGDVDAGLGEMRGEVGSASWIAVEPVLW